MDEIVPLVWFFDAVIVSIECSYLESLDTQVILYFCGYNHGFNASSVNSDFTQQTSVQRKPHICDGTHVHD